MLQCEVCRGHAVQLVRSASRVWFGCLRCNQTWHIDVERCRTVPKDTLAGPHDGASTPELSHRSCLLFARTKDNFLALISHGLWTPMSVVLYRIVAIRRQRINPGGRNRALKTIERYAGIPSRLVDDVLDRSRIATGTRRLDRHVISLTTVIRDAVDQIGTKLESAGLRLALSEPAGDPKILGDSVRLQQVLANLLTNAITFTPRDGRIFVKVMVTHDRARVEVSSGSGSGMAMGSTFTITMPLAQRPLQPNAMMDSGRNKANRSTIRWSNWSRPK